MEAIRLRAAFAALVALACLAGLAGAALPAANTTAMGVGNVTANLTAAATPTVLATVATPTPNATVPFTLVLNLTRTPAVFGDTVRCSGTGAENASVRLLVDGVEVGRAVPANGTYRFDLAVDRIAAGTHVVHADGGPLRSADASLEVAAVDPVVLLDVTPTVWQNESALHCIGNVTAAGRAVPGAAVRLVFDGAGSANCTTGPAGQFELLAGVAGGSHRVVANVSFDDGRPINPGSSRVAEAEVPGGFSVLPVVGLLVVLLLVGAGGFLFWRRNRTGEPGTIVRPAPARVVPVAPEPVVEAPPAPTPVEDLRATAREIAGDGGRGGVEAVYRALVERLAEAEPGARLGSMTPRELAAHFTGTPAGVAVARVAACYEAVAYSGREPTPVDVETAVEGYVAALAETARAGR
ncbi:MAG: DUF4129 domain-containing protein [Methanospirillum sp.]